MKKYVGIICFFLWATSLHAQKVDVFSQIPSDQFEVSASSSFPKFPASALIDGSGMRGRMHASDNLGKNMWISEISTKNTRAVQSTREGVVWLLFAFGVPTHVDCIQIWNHNQNQHTRRGLNKVYIEYSSDGITWQTLKNKGLDYHIISQSHGKALEPVDFILETSGIQMKYFCITADPEEGNHYHDKNERSLQEAADMSQNVNYYGLSEVRFYRKERKSLSELDTIKNLSFSASQGYLKTPEGPTREFTIHWDAPLYSGGKITMELNGKRWVESIAPNPAGITSIESKFPAGYMEESTEMVLELASTQAKLKKEVQIPGARKWTLYFLPHSHQDIGYTHRQEDVMKLQWRNLERAMDLSERTAAYPDGARFKWNSEATWSVKGYLDFYRGTDKEKKLIQAIQTGNVGIDATLGSILTGICKQEELMHLFDDAHQISKQTGVEFNTAMMSDVPGQSWGLATALSQNGVKYFSPAPNYVPFWGKTGCDRAALFHVKWGDVPFYWQSQSGTDKVLYWQTGKGYSWFHGWLLDRLAVCGVTPIWEYLSGLEVGEYPYAMTYLRYTVHGDNGPPDEWMPDIIREWNEKYEYPQFRIGTTKELFTEFEKEYGNYLPVYSGDMTPVWEDGAASTARELTMNRTSSERLNQTEILWSMLNPATFPAKDFSEAWKNVVLFSEHTWGASASGPEPESQFTKDLWQGKKMYADSADIQSRRLYNNSLTGISSNENSKNYIQVFNTNLWTRTDVVTFESASDLSGKVLQSPSGEFTPVQKLDNGHWIFLAKAIPPLGSVAYRMVENKVKKEPLQSMIQSNTLNNGILHVKIDAKTGVIHSLSAEKDTFNYAGSGGLNGYFYSGRMLENLQTVGQIERITVLNDGEVAATLRVESQAPGCKSLIRDITVYRGIGRIDIANTLDKSNIYKKENVRFSFPFNISNAEITMDMAMGEMHPEREQLSGSNKNFYSILNGLSVNNLNHGIYLTTIDAPFIELGEMTADHWRKGSRGEGWMPSAIISPTVYSWVMNNSWGTNYKASQEGIATFNYSIELCDPYVLQLKKQGMEQAQKMVAVVSTNPTGTPTLFSLQGNNQIAISTIKPSDDGTGYIVRLQNMSKLAAHSSMKWGNLKAEKVYLCNNQQEQTGDFDESSFWLKPHECITLKIVNK